MLFRGINEITSVGLLTELYLFTELKSTFSVEKADELRLRVSQLCSTGHVITAFLDMSWDPS